MKDSFKEASLPLYKNKELYVHALDKICQADRRILLVNDALAVQYVGRLRKLWETIKGKLGGIDRTSREHIEYRVLILIGYGANKGWIQGSDLKKIQEVSEKIKALSGAKVPDRSRDELDLLVQAVAVSLSPLSQKEIDFSTFNRQYFDRHQLELKQRLWQTEDRESSLGKYSGILSLFSGRKPPSDESDVSPVSQLPPTMPLPVEKPGSLVEAPLLDLGVKAEISGIDENIPALLPQTVLMSQEKVDKEKVSREIEKLRQAFGELCEDIDDAQQGPQEQEGKEQEGKGGWLGGFYDFGQKWIETIIPERVLTWQRQTIQWFSEGVKQTIPDQDSMDFTFTERYGEKIASLQTQLMEIQKTLAQLSLTSTDPLYLEWLSIKEPIEQAFQLIEFRRAYFAQVELLENTLLMASDQETALK
jgi:hypothetical protein